MTWTWQDYREGELKEHKLFLPCLGHRPQSTVSTGLHYFLSIYIFGIKLIILKGIVVSHSGKSFCCKMCTFRSKGGIKLKA